MHDSFKIGISNCNSELDQIALNKKAATSEREMIPNGFRDNLSTTKIRRIPGLDNLSTTDLQQS